MEINSRPLHFGQVAAKSLARGAIVKLEQVDGKFVKQNIFAGEPIIAGKVSDTRDSLSTELPQGYRVFDIPSGGIGYIKPGDHVDVIGTFKLEGNGNVAETRTVMRNVKVFAINGVTTRESDGKQTSGQAMLQLQVKESQVEALTLASKLGEMRISLRPFGEDQNDSEADNGESFVSWVRHNERELDTPSTAAPLTSPNVLNQPQPVATKSNKESTNEMLIVTPNGISRYQWTGNELPKLVSDEEKEGAKPGLPPQGPAGWPYAAGNVYSGFGGYTPTYPTSADTPADQVPGTVGGEAPPKEAPKID